MSAQPDPTIAAEDPPQRSVPRTRRALLSAGLGAAIATIASALGTPSRARAAAGSSLIVGSQANNAGTADTQLIASSNVIAFKLLQQGPGTALMGHATQTSGATRGVYGRTDSPDGFGVQARSAGAAGSGAAVQAIGVNNHALEATTTSGARFGAKVVNTSSGGTALRAEGGNAISAISQTAGLPASYGENLATTGVGYGVFGRSHSTSTEAAGVGGETTATSGVVYGVFGRSHSAGFEAAGVKGEAVTASGGIGVIGTAVFTGGIGVYAEAGSNLDSGDSTGLLAETHSGGYGVISIGDTNVVGDLVVTGSKMGYVVDVAVNSSRATLRQGDAVTLLGARAPVVGQIPVLEVGPAKQGDPVIGVMDRRVTVSQAARRGIGNNLKGSGTSAAAGELLYVVTLGAFAMASADADEGAIAPGTRLSAGKNGKLVKAKPIDVGGRSIHAPGENVGYALGTLSAGSGKVAVFVNPH